MATQTKFKGAVYLTKAQYDTLASDGTITAGGVTLTYSPTDTLYITLDESASSITVDDALSATSENPVQNKAIAAKFDTMVDLTSDQTIAGDKTFTDTVYMPDGVSVTFGAQDTTSLRQSSQGFYFYREGTLSGEPYTIALPDASGTLALTSDLDDYATASDLEAEETTRTANDAALQTQIDAKQDALVSGTSIKTVNGESLLGSGNLSIVSANDATITITQGGTAKGSFTLNQSSAATIELDEGGTDVSFSQAVTSGTTLGTITIGDTATAIYAPSIDDWWDDTVSSAETISARWKFDNGITINSGAGIYWAATGASDAVYANPPSASGNILTTGDGYTQAQVDSLLSTMRTASMQVVSSLPTTGEEGIIYLVGSESPYAMWIYESSSWISLGTTEVDLSGYVDLTSAQEISGEKTFLAKVEFGSGAVFGQSGNTKIDDNGGFEHTEGSVTQSFEFPTDKSGTLALTSDLDDYATASDLEAEETTRTANDAALQTQIDAKQDALVSGTSIKTVNGESLLGSGDVSISGTFTASTAEATVTLSVPSSQLSAIPSGEQLVMETNTGTVEWTGLPMGAIPISMSFEGAFSGLSLKLTYKTSASAAGKITEEYDDSGTKTITRVVQGAATATNNTSSSITPSSVSVKVTGTLTYVVLSV